MVKRRQRLLVTSAAVLGTFLGAGAMTAPAMASTHPAVASTHPATTAQPATSTNIDKGYEGESGCSIGGWAYCLWYSQNIGGAMWGTNQQSFGTIIATFPNNGTGAGKPVRNDAASMADNTADCNLHNNEASISYNDCS